MEDIEIIDLFWERSEAAIHETERKYGKLCYKVANKIILNVEDVEECVNDVYMSAWNTIPPERPQTLSSYLCKLTRNIACKRARYNHAVKRSNEYVTSLSEIEECISEECDIDSKLNMEYLVKTIEDFLNEYSSEKRNIFLRRYFHFDSYEKIAETYGYKVTKIKVMLYRMREKLREYLDKRGYSIN